MNRHDNFGSMGSAANSFSDTISSAASSTPTTTSGKASRLSASGISKIDRIYNQNSSEIEKPSKCVVCTKWLVTVTFGGLFLFCLVASKLSFIGLAAKLNKTGSCFSNQGGSNKTDGRECCMSYTLIILILIIPNFINFVRFMWTSLFRKDRKWPTKTKAILSMVISFLESFGLCLFALKILKTEESAVVTLLMDTVFLGHIFSKIVAYIRGRSNDDIRKQISFIVSTISVVAGFGLTTYVIHKKLNEDKLPTSDLWHVFVAIPCLSIAWLPWLRKKIILVIRPPEVNQYEPDFLQRTESLESDKMSSIVPGVSSVTNSEDTDDDEDDHVETSERYTHKLMIISSFTKIISTIFWAFILQDVIEGSPSQSINQITDGWSLSFDIATNYGRQTYYFIFNIITSLFAYILGLYALRTQMSVGSFAIPLMISTPLTFTLLYIPETCKAIYFVNAKNPYLVESVCYDSRSDLEYLLPALFLLWIAQVLSTGLYAIRTSTFVLQKEVKLFWMPLYNSLLQDQWMLLDRRSVLMDDTHENPEDQVKRTKVYICTTMYRETREEMKQLLESLSKINAAKQIGNRHFESHIIFDGGIKGNVIGEKALQLLSLIPEVLRTGDVDTCTKADFPYGLRLSWALPSSNGERSGQPMTFVIHLKDNRKVKNKKRWSQIMYMSYILDFLVKEDTKVDDETAFILTTDADVKFTPDSVEALLDLMTRDTAVGAVCARTFPQGEGPLYWYQKFEYAIGHWFQKAAEHVLGSVLCAPGCFSVYRVKALRDIIPTYSSNVEKGLEFLTKDMGEDRWLCTLMVQSGWRIDYCAASSNYTNCPAEFDEFYTQRRRWIGSTLANLYLLLKESHIVRKLNHGISFWFLLYQAGLLVSTVLGPSTVMLIVSGGLAYAWGMDTIETVLIQFAITVAFGLICLKTSNKTQLLLAKILTFAYALVMMAVVVGTAEQIVENLAGLNQKPYKKGNETIEPTYSPDSISEDLPISITTIYFGGLIGLFLLTGLLHLTEFSCLFQGLWFLLCLPSGYILLIVYSICNITDRSWGTREDKQENTIKKANTWYEYIGQILRQVFFCCDRKEHKEDKTNGKETQIVTESPVTPRKRILSDASELEKSLTKSISRHPKGEFYERQESVDDTVSTVPEDYVYGDEDEIIKVEDWISQIDAGLKSEYVQLFKIHGYDDTSFIASMTEVDLKRIGIKKRTQRNLLENRIKDLPDFLIEAAVPNNVDTWLKDIGLHQYKPAFTKCHIRATKDLEQLKSFDRKDIENELGITKAAHVKRLLDAIKFLRTPTKEEILNADIKLKLDNAIKHDIKRVNPPEYDFWKQLTETHLKPTSEAFSIEGQLKTKLEELRNTWLMILLAVNSLWLVLISTLASKINLTVLGSNPVGLVFLLIFGVLLLVQFFCMILHRLYTLAHFLARAPYKFGHEYKSSWSYKNDEDLAAVADAKRAERLCRQRERERTKKKGQRPTKQYDERMPLIQDENV